MRNWSRRHTLISGIALILVANAVVLGGVAWNRSGDPECTLALTQRELQQPYWRGMNRENSGMSMRLNWRVIGGDKRWNYSYSGGAPDWLDQAKMESLGFDVSVAQGMKANHQTNRQLSKEVLLVLEMDGPAYQQVLQGTRQNAAEQDARLAAQPDSEELKRKAKQAQDEAKREEQDNSRLFAVDAGLNQAELRAKYPDRSHYAIVRGQVRPWSTGKPEKIMGYINRISIDGINVPYELRSIFEQSVLGQPSARQTFEASVAFGQRLEPWLLGISAGAK